MDFTSAVRSMSVHLDLAVTQEGLKARNGSGGDDCDDDVDDEEEEDDDNETGVGQVQEVVAAGMFDWMGLSSTPVPVIVPLAEGERALTSSSLPSCYMTLHNVIFLTSISFV